MGSLRIGRREEFRKKKIGAGFFILSRAETCISFINALEYAGSIANSGLSFSDRVGRQRRQVCQHEELVQKLAANDLALCHQCVSMAELLINYNRNRRGCKNKLS